VHQTLLEDNDLQKYATMTAAWQQPWKNTGPKILKFLSDQIIPKHGWAWFGPPCPIPQQNFNFLYQNQTNCTETATKKLLNGESTNTNKQNTKVKTPSSELFLLTEIHTENVPLKLDEMGCNSKARTL